MEALAWRSTTTIPHPDLTNHRNPGYDKSAKQFKPCNVMLSIVLHQISLYILLSPISLALRIVKQDDSYNRVYPPTEPCLVPCLLAAILFSRSLCYSHLTQFLASKHSVYLSISEGKFWQPSLTTDVNNLQSVPSSEHQDWFLQSCLRPFQSHAACELI